MSETGLVPRLRFPEFRDAGDWVEKPLAKLVLTVTPPKKLQTADYAVSGKYPIVDQSQDFICGWTNDSDAIIRDDLPLIVFGDHTCVLKLIEQPFAQGADGIKILDTAADVSVDFLFQSLQAAPLITRIGNIGFPAIVDWEYEFSIYVTLAVIKKSDQFNSRYLYCYIQSEQYQAEIISKSLLNAVPCKINMDELRKTKILLPPPAEQQEIAGCLTSIDDLITAEAQKLDALTAHKKGLMQQLFPTSDEVRG